MMSAGEGEFDHAGAEFGVADAPRRAASGSRLTGSCRDGVDLQA